MALGQMPSAAEGMVRVQSVRGGQAEAVYDIIREFSPRNNFHGDCFRFAERQFAGFDVRSLQEGGLQCLVLVQELRAHH